MCMQNRTVAYCNRALFRSLVIPTLVHHLAGVECLVARKGTETFVYVVVCYQAGDSFVHAGERKERAGWKDREDA